MLNLVVASIATTGIWLLINRILSKPKKQTYGNNIYNLNVRGNDGVSSCNKELSRKYRVEKKGEAVFLRVEK